MARPPGTDTFDPIYCEMLIDHMGKGYSYQSFAGKIGVSRVTLYSWEKEHEPWCAAKEDAFNKCLLFWEEQGIEGLHNQTIKDGDGMTVTKSVNAQLYKFQMINRFRKRKEMEDYYWSERPEDSQDADKPKDQDAKLSVEQALELVKAVRGAKE